MHLVIALFLYLLFNEKIERYKIFRCFTSSMTAETLKRLATRLYRSVGKPFDHCIDMCYFFFFFFFDRFLYSIGAKLSRRKILCS